MLLKHVLHRVQAAAVSLAVSWGPISTNVFNMANSAQTADPCSPLPLCFDEGASFDFLFFQIPCECSGQPPPCPPSTHCAQDLRGSSPPSASQSPTCTPAATLHFGLIFVLLSFCASPCAVIYNLPLLSGLTGSSGVTALAARTASTSQSQQHDGTPQSGKRTGSPPSAHLPAGARGRRKERASRGKTKIKMCFSPCL